jgi:hypothetical protein
MKQNERATGRETTTGRLTGGGGKRRRGCRAAAIGLLGHLQQAASRKRVGDGGAPPCTGSTASSSWATERERDDGRMFGRFLVMARIFSGKNGSFI